MKKVGIVFILVVLVLPIHSYPQTVPQIETTETLETTHFIIYYREDHAVIAQEVAEIAESIYDDVTSFMEYTPEEKIEISIYPSRFNFAFSINPPGSSGLTFALGCPFSTESLGMDPPGKKWLVSVGLYSSLLSEMLSVDETALTSTHFWLGLAVQQYAASRGEDKMVPIAVHVLRETNNLPASLDDITYDNYGLLAQPLSLTIAQYMVDAHGEESFTTFLHALKEWDQTKTSVQNVDNALQKAFGVTREEFEQEWLSYINEFPVLEEDCNAVQITDSWGFKAISDWHNNKILYTGVFRVSDFSKNLEIFAMNADGSDVKRLTDDLASDFDARFSPDGEKIAFTSLRDGYANIYSMNEDGSAVQQLTFDTSMDYMGSWSFDGEKIAFTSARSGNYDIYCMNEDGSAVQQLTTHPGADGWPIFSPDGLILFVSDRNGSYDLYTMHADGTNITQLTNTPEYENFPQYSPDGKQIVFSSRGENELPEICIMNADGTGRELLISQPVVFIDEKTLPSLIGYPVWSPDGEEIAFIVGTQIFAAPVEEPLTWVILAVVAVLAGIVLAVAVVWKRK